MANAKQNQRRQTRMQQAAAEKGGTVSPRGLARSMAHRHERKDWREYAMEQPRKGRKYLKRIVEPAAIRTLTKIEG